MLRHSYIQAKYAHMAKVDRQMRLGKSCSNPKAAFPPVCFHAFVAPMIKVVMLPKILYLDLTQAAPMQSFLLFLHASPTHRALNAVGCETSLDAALCVLLFLHSRIVLAHIRRMGISVGAVTDGHTNSDLVLVRYCCVVPGACSTYQSLQGRPGIVGEVIIILHLTWLEKEQERTSTELEVAQFFCSLDLVACLSRDDRATHHHCTYTDHHHPTMTGRVDGDYDANVFAIHVKSRSNCHRVHCVILALNRLGLTHYTVYRDMEAMVVLRGEAEDTKGAAYVALCILGICIAQEPLEGELPALHPD